jgi:hypothetical protein
LTLLERDAQIATVNAAIQHRLGLSQYLLGWRKEAEHSLLMAALLDPNQAEYAYHLAVFYRDAQLPELALPWARHVVALRPAVPQFKRLLDEIQAELPARPLPQP